MAPNLARCFLIALFAGGCFDVEQRDADLAVEPFLVDDFERNTGIPPDGRFERWSCYRFNPSTPEGLLCSFEPHDEGQALVMDFTVTDVEDGIQKFAGAGVSTYTDSATIDFSSYRKLVFSAILEGSTPALPAGTIFYVELGCRSVPLESPIAGGDRYVSLGVDLGGPTWSSHELSLTSFGQPAWHTNHLVGGAPACLRAVDSIAFAVSPNLMDGMSAAGKFQVDDIWFR
jgi:hypothetical protein